MCSAPVSGAGFRPLEGRADHGHGVRNVGFSVRPSIRHPLDIRSSSTRPHVVRPSSVRPSVIRLSVRPRGADFRPLGGGLTGFVVPHDDAGRAPMEAAFLQEHGCLHPNFWVGCKGSPGGSSARHPLGTFRPRRGAFCGEEKARFRSDPI